jgi:hypothetical protein
MMQMLMSGEMARLFCDYQTGDGIGNLKVADMRMMVIREGIEVSRKRKHYLTRIRGETGLVEVVDCVVDDGARLISKVSAGVGSRGNRGEGICIHSEAHEGAVGTDWQVS